MQGQLSFWRRIGWLTLAVAPPTALGTAFLPWVNRHPLAALGLTVGYELVLAVIAFAGAVAGDLRGRWRERIVERLDQRLVRRLSRFDGHYRTYVLRSLRYIDLTGSGCWPDVS